MPPLPPKAEEIKWHEEVFTALHALMVGAILNVLVFVQMAAGRKDNTSQGSKSASSPSSESEDPRPDVELFLFGISFFLYLVLKGFQIAIPFSWFETKKYLDEVALLVGAISMAVLLATITLSFTLCIALPAIVLMIVGRVSLGVGALEWAYVKLLQLKKYGHLSLSWFRWVMARVRVGFSYPSQGQRHAIDAASTEIIHRRDYWNKRILAAKIKADEEIARRNAEEIGDKTALNTSDHDAIIRFNEREREMRELDLEAGRNRDSETGNDG
ncbi:unnamed protein product [Arabis nemorensis]|uniref:Uncharacterized protein n=1 Tax=Arabis nemorensis TaxID=586526 RepID=A0A565BGP1_9BRAS|nr:unnamed protein product [Arabis nemorensis]